MPPSIVSMRVVERERTKFRLWFPLFLLWPLFVPLLVLTFMATLVADLVGLLSARRFGFTRFIVGVLGTVGETRGTEVLIQERTHTQRVVAFTLH